MSAGGDPFEYAALRVVPRVDRGEFLNAGVILYCQGRSYLRCAVHLDAGRLLALAPGLDLDPIRTALAGVCAVCDGDPGAGPAATRPLRERFGLLTAPRSSVIQAGPVHPGLTIDPERALRRLTARLVLTD